MVQPLGQLVPHDALQKQLGLTHQEDLSETTLIKCVGAHLVLPKC